MERTHSGDQSGPRFGFVAQTHTVEMPYDEAIERAGSLGFDFVEIVMDGAAERRRLDEARIRSLSREHGVDVVVHLPFIDVELGSPRELLTEASVTEMKRCIDTATRVGAEKGVIHPSTHSLAGRAWDEEEIYPTIIDSINDIDEHASEAGFELCVENLGPAFPVAEFDRVFEGTDASMTLDTGHARIGGLESEEQAAFVEEHLHRITHVHVNDTRVEEDEHLPAGMGTLDFRTIFAPMNEKGWSGTISLEIFTYNYSYVKYAKEHIDGVFDRSFVSEREG